MIHSYLVLIVIKYQKKKIVAFFDLKQKKQLKHQTHNKHYNRHTAFPSKAKHHTAKQTVNDYNQTIKLVCSIVDIKPIFFKI